MPTQTKNLYKNHYACTVLNARPIFIYVENDNILKSHNLWQYPYPMKDTFGFLGVWKIKYKNKQNR